MGTRLPVLVLGRERAVTTAIAELVRIAGFDALTPLQDENATEAVRRLTPEVVLVDGDCSFATSAHFHELCRRSDAGLVLFALDPAEVERSADRPGGATILLPAREGILAAHLLGAVRRF